MRVLVTFGSRMGGAAGIAGTIADTLQGRGFEVSLRPAGDVRDIEGYDAVVVGGAIYSYRWHKDARHLVKRERHTLKTRPVWLFSSGPLDDTANVGDLPPPRAVQKLADFIHARGHRTFGGRLPADADWFPASALAKTAAGDWRDMAQVRYWATEIANELTWELEPLDL